MGIVGIQYINADSLKNVASLYWIPSLRLIERCWDCYSINCTTMIGNTIHMHKFLISFFELKNNLRPKWLYDKEKGLFWSAL